MKEITPGLPVKVVVDVLRQASKVRHVHLYIILKFLSLKNVSTEHQSIVTSKKIP